MNISDNGIISPVSPPVQDLKEDSVSHRPGAVIDKDHPKPFPFHFLETHEKYADANFKTFRELAREGEKIPAGPFQSDWIFLILSAGAFLYVVIKNISGPLMHDLAKFFLLRGSSETLQRDPGIHFQLNSTLLNLASFLNISLFAYVSAVSFGLIPKGMTGILFWLISLGAVIAAATIRHAISFFTGLVSGYEDVFNEYAGTVYQSYRYSALVLFLLLILVVYAPFPADRTLIFAGLSTFAAFYLLRVLKLLVIFMNRGISLFYLILYLCALEILPVAICIKYLADIA